jgi:hypothetical protein
MRALQPPLVLLLLLATAAAAQSKPTPNFSGYWKLDGEKSDFGGGPAPESASYIIRHIGGKLAFDYTQESKTARIEITTDGQERLTDSNDDGEIWTRAFWERSVLAFEARQRPRPGHPASGIKWTSRWKLSSDAHTLTIERQITTPQGQLNQTLVFNREAKQSRNNSQ